MQYAIYAVSLPTPPPPYPKVRFDLVPPISSRISLRASASPPARDRVIDFGKFKGRMLGSLPSAYLKWVSSNLRAGDTEEWARLADRVLSDPVYRDRLEWEAAEKILSGSNAATSSSRGSAVSELLEISQRFGWDNEDKSGWSKVDFGLLGTSKGGRIPRAGARSLKEEEERSNERNESSGVGKRGERRERVRRMREKTTSARSMEEERGTSYPAVGGAAAASPFPGREALLKKVLNREKLRFIALYTSKCIFPLDDELSEIVGHSYLFLKEQLEISALPPSPRILHGTIIDQFIACGKSRDRAHELALLIWSAVIDNLEDNHPTFLLLKCLALEGDVFLPYPYSRSYKVEWKYLKDFSQIFVTAWLMQITMICWLVQNRSFNQYQQPGWDINKLWGC